jgi:hypothetical protein
MNDYYIARFNVDVNDPRSPWLSLRDNYEFKTEDDAERAIRADWAWRKEYFPAGSFAYDIVKMTAREINIFYTSPVTEELY